MPRNKTIAVVALLFVALGAAGGALLWGLQQVPPFYEEALAEQPDREVRKDAAKKLVQRTLSLAEEIKRSDDWSEEFTQSQVNAWLAEELETKFAELVPKGVSDLRIKFVEDILLVGFHYADKKYSGVISLSLKPWVIEPNRVAIEIESIRAGAIPVPLDKILDSLSNGIHTEGWQIESRQANGNDVIVLQLDPDQTSQPVLEAVKVVDGKLQVAGTRRTQMGRSGGNQHPRMADQSPQSATKLKLHR